jgi:hypothetical protein
LLLDKGNTYRHRPPNYSYKKVVLFLIKVIDNLHTVDIVAYDPPGAKRDKALQVESDLNDSLMISLFRTKRIIKDIAINNDFDYFMTNTFDPKIFDSTKIDLVLGIWTKLARLLRVLGVKYLVTPEYHSDKKKIHLHILLKAPKSFESFFKWGYLKNKKTQQWEYTGSEFKLFKWGFTTIKRVGKTPKDTIALGLYLNKYVSKDMITLFGKKRLWASKGLKRGVQHNLGVYSKLNNYISPDLIKWDFVSTKYSYKSVTIKKLENESYMDTIKRHNKELRVLNTTKHDKARQLKREPVDRYSPHL